MYIKYNMIKQRWNVPGIAKDAKRNLELGTWS